MHFYNVFVISIIISCVAAYVSQRRSFNRLTDGSRYLCKTTVHKRFNSYTKTVCIRMNNSPTTVERDYPQRFNQTKYQHNATQSNGRANIFNEDSECKLWGAENRVDGGIEADIGEFPCIALLEYLFPTNTYKFGCAGSLINHRYVLTAAKCLKKNLVNIRLGEYDTNKTLDCDEDGECQPEVINVGIERVIKHKKYSSSTHQNYIGLIRLNTDVSYEDYFIKPICIPDATMSTAIGAVAKVGGWGRDGDGHESPILRSVWVHMIDLEQCRNVYGSNRSILSSQLCAGGERNKNACDDDLGGPLLMRYNRRSYLEGILSFSSGCKRSEVPDIYTKVSSFYGWIQNNLEP